MLDPENGTVVGVVSSKHAPLPKHIDAALSALEKQRSGFTFPVTLPDGTKTTVSEAQVISQVLQYLRSQTQLVIGYSTTLDDLRSFLKQNGVDP